MLKPRRLSSTKLLQARTCSVAVYVGKCDYDKGGFKRYTYNKDRVPNFHLFTQPQLFPHAGYVFPPRHTLHLCFKSHHAKMG